MSAELFLPPATDLSLQAYLLGSIDFEAALAFQRRLVFQVSGDRSSSFLVLCEHPPLATIGRHGSRSHLLFEPDELRVRRWPVRWVNRGGGAMLHLPGQLAAYCVLPLDRLGLGLEAYLERLHTVVIAVLDDFNIRAEAKLGQPGVWVADRPIAGVGVAVRDWVAYYGIYLNVSPDLSLFRRVRFSGSTEPMTSLARERRGLVRPGHVRERFLEHFAQRFSFGRTALFHNHPSLARRAPSDAIPANH
jgi:lipoyl(octanoyl) transferase